MTNSLVQGITPDGARLVDPVREAFEAWLAKGTPGRTVEDLWLAFLTGHMLAEVSAAKGHAYALAIVKGEKPAAVADDERPASNPRTWQTDLNEDR